MRVLVAMSGGVDSSVAAASLVADGHEVTGVTMKLWGGESDTGCCSVADVDDARRVAQQLGIAHHVFNFGDDFQRDVVGPYIDAHRVGETPNPCIECNRRLKFDRLLRRARQLGFDRVATGHHARVVRLGAATGRLARGEDVAKDQSYVLYVVPPAVLRDVEFPVGGLTKAQVRQRAAELGLRTARKPDSQDVCFVTARDGRRGFLAERLELHPGVVVDDGGRVLGEVDAIELVTVGQRRGLGLAGGSAVRVAVEVDVPRRRVAVGSASALVRDAERLERVMWHEAAATLERDAAAGLLVAQCSAHGAARAVSGLSSEPDGISVTWTEPAPRVAPGQSIVLYRGDVVVGGGVVASDHSPR